MMELPQDMKRFDGREWDDSFQLIPPHAAGWVIFGMVCVAAILEPVLR